MRKFYILLIIGSLLQIVNLKEEFELFRENEDFEEVNINGESELEYEIKKDKSYIFNITNESHFYCFSALIENIFFIKKENDEYINRPNETFFEPGEIIYVNHLKNLNDTKIKISPINIYTELNSFETINENKYFVIKAKNKSIAYFDSFDRNSKIYLSESRQKAILESDKRINGKFIDIEEDSTYLIKNEIFNISVFTKYFYPVISTETQIDIEGDNKNSFYFSENGNYILNFKENSMNKMIKLSSKTPNSKIKIINNETEIKELNKNSPYYILDKNFLGQLQINVKNSALIELLFNYGDYEILTDEKREKSKIKKNIEIIKIPFTHKSFEINISSNKNFKYSLSFGLSNKEEYFFSSNANQKINSKNNEESLTYLALFKNIILLNNEFLSIVINFEKGENQDIFISYRQFSELDELLDEKLDPNYCQQVIKLFQELFASYIYLDIAQNPPDIGIPNYHHRKINLIEELGKISTENRKFYEFYQEIRETYMIVRDGHLYLYADKTPSGIQFSDYSAISPFKYIIREYKGEKRLFIAIREDFILKYDNYTQEFLREHIDIPIKTINNEDPIDYLQNWSKYLLIKNKNSNFVSNNMYISGFYFPSNPLNYEELIQNEFEFEDNKIIRISYIIEKPEAKSEQFKQFFLETLKKNKKMRYLPTLEEIKDKFYFEKKMRNSINNEETKIEWDIYYNENKKFIKCRVDQENEVNVFVQNTFSLDYGNAVGNIFKCVELFHSNNYPLIIIESENGGGYPTISYLMIQLFQMREVERTYSALRYIENNIKNFNIENDYGEDYLYDPETCKSINSFDDLNETTDYYNYSGLNITHKRTNVFVELCGRDERKAFNEFRKKYENSPNLKRPTDIIVFTDGYSFSSASTFIKGLQNIGGAIIVGYSGNPKIETDLFDASQSDSGTYYFENAEITKNFEKLGFILGSITVIEIFDDSYKGSNPIPREYTMIPIDYRTDIYSPYSDDVYSQFIEKGKEVHKMFNEENYCNSKNKKLLLHDDNNCKTFENLEHAHGGYQCGENNKWDKTKCVPYYCDIGYSFDQYLKKCIKDCMVDWPTYFIYQDNYTNDYTIKQNEAVEFITSNPNGLYYVFESSENYIENYPDIFFIKGNQKIKIYNKGNETNDILLKINTVDTDINIMNFKGDMLLFDKLFFLKEKKMAIIRSNKEHIILFKENFNNKITQLKYLKYNNSIKYQDIIDIKDEYFLNYSGYSFNLEKDETYIIYYNHNIDEEISVTINPIESNQVFSVDKSKINFLYLKKGNTYTLEFSDSLEDMMIKLSRETSNSEISIEDNKYILNSDNLYYHYKKNNNKKLKVKIDKNDAIIEFLYNLTNDNIIQNINFEKSQIKINNETNIIKIPKEYKNINLQIKIDDINNTEYSIFQGYSIPPFSHDYEPDESDRMTLDIYNINISDPYDKKNKIAENEYYIIAIKIFGGQLDIQINGEKIENKGNNEEEKKGLEWYFILLIVIGSLLFIALVIILIIIIKRKRGNTSENIEDKMQNLTSV